MTPTRTAPTPVMPHPGFGLRGRLVLVLLAGRGTFRATSQLAPLLLVTVWGAAGFGNYASAVGVSAWTVFVAISGEKAALKLIPRTRRISGDVARVVLAVAVAPLLVAVLAVAGALVTGAGPRARLFLFAVVWYSVLGLLQVVTGLHRVRGAPVHDAATFLAMTGAVAVSTLLTLHFGWSPERQLICISLAALAVSAVLLLRLPRAWTAVRPVRRGVVAPVLRTAGLLGLPELLASASIAVCYLALAVAGRPADSALFYVAVVVSGFCSAGTVYLLRLGQPATSRRLRGPAGAAGRRRAGRILSTGVTVSAAGTLVLVTASAMAPHRPGWLLLAALTAVGIPLFTVVTYAGYLVENTDGRSLAITATAAAVGLGTVAVTVPVLVPAAGAAGAMAALLASLGAVAFSLRIGLSRRSTGGRS